MTKHILAVGAIATLLQATAARADAQINIYGQMDVGLTKYTGATWGVDRGAPNWLGFRGTEDLGGGMQASFRIETRFDPDTGANESGGRRPLFQGRSWVGITGKFGTVRLGRDYTAMQDLIVDFDPWGFFTVGTLLDAAVGSYSSDPSYAGSSGNRFSNGIYYSSPQLAGFQAYITVASKEGLVGGPQLKKNPVSYAASYINGPLYLMVGAERSTAQDRFWNLSGSYRVGPANLMASYSRVDPLAGPDSSNKLVGADIAIGSGQVKLGAGKISSGTPAAARQLSAGYWHSLSKRTTLYTDATRRTPDTGASSTAFDLGIRHTF